VTVAGAIGRWRYVALGLGVAYALYLARGDTALFLVILAAAGTTVALRFKEHAVPLVLIAVLAVPVSDSLGFVRHHAYDSSYGGGFLSAREANLLSRYLTAHDDGARYEAVVLSVWQAANLVVLDRRPVLATRNVDGSPLLKVSDLQSDVREGQVRFVVVGSPCVRHPTGGRCPPAARWARQHGTLVPGVVPHLGLYRMTS
jgi:hypothetical protein